MHAYTVRLQCITRAAEDWHLGRPGHDNRYWAPPEGHACCTGATRSCAHRQAERRSRALHRDIDTTPTPPAPLSRVRHNQCCMQTGAQTQRPDAITCRVRPLPDVRTQPYMHAGCHRTRNRSRVQRAHAGLGQPGRRRRKSPPPPFHRRPSPCIRTRAARSPQSMVTQRPHHCATCQATTDTMARALAGCSGGAMHADWRLRGRLQNAAAELTTSQVLNSADMDIHVTQTLYLSRML